MSSKKHGKRSSSESSSDNSDSDASEHKSKKTKVKRSSRTDRHSDSDDTDRNKKSQRYYTDDDLEIAAKKKRREREKDKHGYKNDNRSRSRSRDKKEHNTHYSSHSRDHNRDKNQEKDRNRRHEENRSDVRTSNRDYDTDRNRKDDRDDYYKSKERRDRGDTMNERRVSSGKRDMEDKRDDRPSRDRRGERDLNERRQERDRRDDDRRDNWKYKRENRRNRGRSRSRSFDHTKAKWGKNENRDSKTEKQDPHEKQKPNFALSGKLTEETNTYKGVVVKYSEPPEARKAKRRWRLYPFKGEKALQTLYIHRESAYLIGRDRKVVDLPVDHPSCSKQHAALQYRLVPFTRDDGSTGKRVRPYLIDLDSANGTFINNKKIDARKYVELLERDVIKFGFSSREYVLLHENSKDEALDDDVKQEDEEVPVKVEPKEELD